MFACVGGCGNRFPGAEGSGLDITEVLSDDTRDSVDSSNQGMDTEAVEGENVNPDTSEQKPESLSGAESSEQKSDSLNKADTAKLPLGLSAQDDIQEPKSGSLTQADTQEPKLGSLTQADTKEPKSGSLTQSDAKEPKSGSFTQSDAKEPKSDSLAMEGTSDSKPDSREQKFVFDINDVPAYSGKPYYVLNENHPLFGEEEIGEEAFFGYSELDELGRCGVATAIVSEETIPEEERGPIGDVKPSGWHTVKYNDLIDGNYLYNRCHLIAYQLSGENANPKNLITGTRYFNVEGMLPFENSVFDYIKSGKNHVAYRVTPIFEGENLVASGVTMEAYSVEDDGAGICFYVYVYNVQPGIEIDYLTGESRLAKGSGQQETGESEAPPEQIEINSENGENSEQTYVINANSHKFHRPTCKSVAEMKEKNKKISTQSREELVEQGYSPCKRCNP